MRRFLTLVFIGENGKLSVTVLFGLLGFAIILTLFVKGLLAGVPIDNAWLSWSIEIAAIAVGLRAGQRGLQYLGEGIATVGTRKKEISKEVDQNPEIVKVVAPRPVVARPDYQIFIKPSEGTVTSGFRTPQRPTHHGIDIAKNGHVPILAAADGVVVKSYLSSTYGDTVILEHIIDEQRWQTLYAHLAPNSRIDEGIQVRQGDVVGMMGNTGRSTGQHLHFEIHKGAWNISKSNAVDPEKYI